MEKFKHSSRCTTESSALHKLYSSSRCEPCPQPTSLLAFSRMWKSVFLLLRVGSTYVAKHTRKTGLVAITWFFDMI